MAILIRKDGHYSVILMLISSFAKLSTDLVEFMAVAATLISLKTGFIIPLSKALQTTGIVSMYTFEISFLIFMLRYRKNGKKQ
ncbi:hypothetical protein OK18_11520 [Chryseobacterium gallinarum]|uniref:Uncharacterized protein n=1 Tax=Chryseobacterium gallinarum TaxID=1324352 RepID=A0A0G3M570_CHRGL|nr:hypothetical protein OK18_11520 [Chryseobacterium gallinarum]